MIKKEDALKIAEKYGRDYGSFQENASRKEFRTVLKYIAEEANRKQWKIMGLDKSFECNTNEKMTNKFWVEY